MNRTATAALSPITGKALSITVLVIVIPLLYLAITSLLAGVSHQQAKLFLEDWGRVGKEPSERAWLFARDAAENAVAKSPVDNGEYADTLGRVYEWHRVFAPFGDAEAEDARRQAVAAYRKSIVIRPLWPYTHIQLAYAKLRLLELDDEFHQALAEARRLGAGRMRVHALLAEIGMISWPQLSIDEQNATWQSLELVLRYQPNRAKSLQTLAQNAGLYPQLCAALDRTLLQQRSWCK